ncbi:hypothetical protein [Acidiphilium acidophilum]|uniref:hypothetical protein n=1 Tax=Acidiphilium acidophilum TaxID=76588 RepID=UPI002E8E619B|nr:hypothetical protein [Acidiphilium acidophilum]
MSDNQSALLKAADTATRTGQSERAVQRDAHRGSRISADVLSEIKGTELDKGTVLDAIAGISPLHPSRISLASTSTSQSTTGLYLAFRELHGAAAQL